MKIKLEDIAIKSGYSISTVSRVLSGKAKGRSQSVYDIIHTARDLGYKTFLNQYENIDIPIDLALVTQHDAEEFYSCLYESFDRTASKMNFQISIHSTQHSDNLIDQIHRISKLHDGIILMAPTLVSTDYEMILHKIQSFPIISIAPTDGNILPTITFDSYEGGRLAGKTLIEAGFQKFGIITGPLIKWEANLRKNGFNDILRKNGYKIDWEYQGDYSFISGKEAFKDARRKDVLGLGIFSSNDQMALGFLHTSLENGFKIPGNFGMVGYDNMPYSKVFYPKLSTINTNLDLLAEASLESLKRKIKNNNTNSTTTLLPVEIVKRRTHSYEKNL
ncbi:MAG: LacI family DNA-binding transcriptional regulator [Candidatus Neomarinimicrobiota bacterium]